MLNYHIFCESCESEYDVSLYYDGCKPPIYCCSCGTPLDESSTVLETEVEDDWENLYREGLDDISDDIGWKDRE